MPPLPKRRKSDSQWPTYVVSGLKTGITFICLGILGFVGSWGIGVSTTMAGLKESILVLQEKERMTTDMVYPQLMEQVRDLKASIRELDAEIKQLNGRKTR